MIGKTIRDKLNALVLDLKNSEGRAQVLASTTLIGLASRRIFNEQQGSENAEEEKLGAYSEKYLITKQKKYKGRNELYVNLYASGTLYGAVKQVKKDGQTYVAVTDVKYPIIPPKTKTLKDGTTKTTKGGGGQSTVEISNYLEGTDFNYGKIFEATNTEAKIVIETVDKFLIKEANESLNQS